MSIDRDGVRKTDIFHRKKRHIGLISDMLFIFIDMDKPQQTIQIAIDGHSSSGKSTLARDMALELGFVYVDTGAMYRAVTLYFIEADIVIEDTNAVIDALEKIEISFRNIDGRNTCFLNGRNVQVEIRDQAVSDLVSEVARIPEVRHTLVKQQRAIGATQDVVMDGRDIGTVVFPDAFLKLFVTADLEERAQRRYVEARQKGLDFTLLEVTENLRKRDFIDSNREHSPLRRADDAYLIDNTQLDRAEQLKLALGLYKKQLTASRAINE